MSTASNSSVSRHVTGNPVVRIANIRDIDFRVILEFFFYWKMSVREDKQSWYDLLQELDRRTVFESWVTIRVGMITDGTISISNRIDNNMDATSAALAF